MNIIKLKDIIKEGDEFFNNHLKGKYAFWIHMRYIVSFDHMDYNGYVSCEMDIDKLLQDCDKSYPCRSKYPYIDTYASCDIYNYIDSTITDSINSISELKVKNEYVPDAEVTVDELKKFRTWLATTLLTFDQSNLGEQLYLIYDNNTTQMLQYYKNGMINDVITSIIDMSVYNNTMSKANTSCGCGCCEDATIDTLYNINNIDCDPVSIYKRNIYNKMVLTFSEIDFWTQFAPEFILEFKKYIDNIIKIGLPLYKTQYINNFVDCTSLVDQNKEQKQNIYILEKLSESLQYISNNDINGHKNYIGDSLREWSSMLYEMMEW